MPNTHADMATYLMAERRASVKVMADHPTLERLVEYHRGRHDMANLAIAYLAGLEGFTLRQTYEAALGATDALAEIVAAVLADPDEAVRDGYAQAELDTQDAHLGGWEPRS